MGNDIETDNLFIDFSIELEKLCYYAGENIYGTIHLMAKPGSIETQLREPKVLISFYEKDINYICDFSLKLKSSVRKLNKYEKYFNFNSFIGANLLNGVDIPFTYQIPLSVLPTCCLFFLNSSHRKHLLSIELCFYKIRREIDIVIKNKQNFTLQNKLLKIPCSIFERKSKSIFLINKGDFIISINLPKNIFYYDEPIPYEFKLDCTNLHLIINCLEISLIRIIKKSSVHDYNIILGGKNEEIYKKTKKIDNNLKQHIFKEELFFPKNLPSDKYIFPPLFYESVENERYFFSKKSSKSPKKKNKITNENIYHIAPSCMGGYLSVDYNLKFKLKFHNSSDEIFTIPIDFYLRPDEKNINNYSPKNNGIFENNNNNQQYYNQIVNVENENLKPNNESGNNENKTLLDNNNNLNVQPQNQIIDDNNENLAPPPILNYSNTFNNNIKNVYGFEIIDHDNL